MWSFYGETILMLNKNQLMRRTIDFRKVMGNRMIDHKFWNAVNYFF